MGFSSNLKLRFVEHSKGAVDATKHRRPLKLAYYEVYESEKLAREREKQLKRFSSAYNALLKRLKFK